jgi:hypothetical protein
MPSCVLAFADSQALQRLLQSDCNIIVLLVAPLNRHTVNQ